MMPIRKIATVLLVAVMLLLTLWFPGAASATAVTPSGVSDSGIEAEIDRVMKKYIGQDVPGAVVSVVMDGKIILTKGYGFANVEKLQPMSPELTYMEAGSVSKVITWTAVMQLVEQGKLSLDTDIRDYLPERFLNLTYDEPITLLHLMSHTAGFEEYLEQLMVRDPDDLVTLEQRVGAGRQPKQIYKPGQTIAYSNYSTSLAGYIVERVSGMSYEQYADEHIFEPLGMTRSSMSPRYDLIPGVMDNKAVGYAQQDGEWTPYPNYYINDGPAGSLITTAEDLAQFMLAQLPVDGAAPNTLFADPATLQAMHETSYTHHPSLPGSAHGYWERFAGGHRIIEHIGNTKAFSSLLSLVPKEGFGISIMTNVEGELTGLRRELTEVLIGTVPTTYEVSPQLNHAGEVAGRYRSARAVESGPFKLIPVIADMDTLVSANGDGSIRLTKSSIGMEATYVEIEPYIYARKTPGNTPMDNEGQDTSRLYFRTNANGDVTQMSYGVIADELPVSALRTPILHTIVVGGAAAIFLLSLLISLIRLVIRMLKRGRSSKAPLQSSALWLSLLGTLHLVNLAAVVVRLAADPFLPLSSLTVHSIFFWLLSIIAMALLYWVVCKWEMPNNTMILKIWTIMLTAALLLVVIFLYSYNLYHIWM